MQTAKEVAAITGGRVVGNQEAVITNLVIDSRSAEPNSLFIPLVGENVDGHRYIQQALANGASASFSRIDIVDVPPTKAIIRVEDPLLALQALGVHRLQEVKPIVVGITGSVGKTSTKELIAAVLQAKYQTFKSPKSYNSEQGLPLTLYQLRDADEVVVLEMGMRGRGQIAQLVNIAPPDIAVITNIGTVHLELLGTRENLALAKGEILAELGSDGVAVVNGDNEWCKFLSERHGGRIIHFGLTAHNDYQAENIQEDELGLFSFDLKHQDGIQHIQLPEPGVHQIWNALAGIAVARELKMTWPEILRGLATYRTIQGRQFFLTVGELTVIDDTYNSNPQSIRASLKILKSTQTTGRRIAVLGDMRELGSVAVESHIAVGKEIGDYQVDVLICLNKLARYIGQEAAAGIEVHYVDTNNEAVQILLNEVAPGDVILVKGSRSLEMETIIQRLKEAYQDV